MDFDKLKFWKKKDEFDLNADLGSLGLGEASPSASSQQPFDQQQQFNQPSTLDTSSYQDTQSQQFDSAFSQTAQQTYPQHQWSGEQQSSAQQSIHPRDIELILSRLETIKASIDHLATRVDNLERSKRW
ncbi:MAG: hypothetical protein ACMXYC_03785 [Candidatus Woesearchaeota archaeon]